jgi:hypothetical protein
VAAKPLGFGAAALVVGTAVEGGIRENPIEISDLDIGDRQDEFTPSL